MKWETLLKEQVDYSGTGQMITTIECPKCGRNIYLDTTMVLTSYPAKYRYWCPCGWTDCAPQRWSAYMKDGEENGKGD